jgi:hypothetical protein
MVPSSILRSGRQWVLPGGEEEEDGHTAFALYALYTSIPTTIPL